MSGHILVVDDDDLLRELITNELCSAGYTVSAFADGQHVLDAIRTSHFDLAIVDLILPDIDGLELVRAIRKIPRSGVIVLSAQAHVADRIVGLEVGADDYMTKPFQPRELVARIHTVLRRVRASSGDPVAVLSDEYEFEGWRLTPASYSVRKPDGSMASFTTGEFKLLEFLVTHPNRFWAIQKLAELAVPGDVATSPGTIMSRIKRLRSQLGEDAKHPHFIATSRGGGYKFLGRVAKVTRS